MILDLAAYFKTVESANRLKGLAETQGELTSFNWDDNSSFDNVRLYGNGYDLYFSQDIFTEGVDNVFAPPPMLDFKRSKKLIITEIDRSDFEVVENFATGTFEISWAGLLIDATNHNFPGDKMQLLSEIFEVNNTWSVAGELFERLKIDSIYFKNDLNISFLEGQPDVIAYSVTARSIRSAEFLLINE